MAMVDISDDIHKMIVKKQSELYESNGKKTKLAEIVEKSIIKGIDEAMTELLFNKGV